MLPAMYFVLAISGLLFALFFAADAIFVWRARGRRRKELAAAEHPVHRAALEPEPAPELPGPSAPKTDPLLLADASLGPDLPPEEGLPIAPLKASGAALDAPEPPRDRPLPLAPSVRGSEDEEGHPPSAAEQCVALSPGPSAAPWRREAWTRYPVVFAHGLFGFDVIEVSGRRHGYFRGIEGRLQQFGTQMYLLRVSPMGAIRLRARQLAEQVRRLPVDRVNIIAHSMGGLDARYAISHLGISDRIASLTTIGTPHHGTPIADLIASLLGERRRREPRVQAFGVSLDLDALYDLTTTKMAAFNRDVADVPGVGYACFVGAARSGVRQVPLLMAPAYLFLSQKAGDNDGLVPAESQKWGEVMGEIDVDHWGQIGWSKGFDAASFYEGVVRELRGRGF